MAKHTYIPKWQRQDFEYMTKRKELIGLQRETRRKIGLLSRRKNDKGVTLLEKSSLYGLSSDELRITSYDEIKNFELRKQMMDEQIKNLKQRLSSRRSEYEYVKKITGMAAHKSATKFFEEIPKDIAQDIRFGPSDDIFDYIDIWERTPVEEREETLRKAVG